jgi:flagellar basal body-associated protein FliL
MSSVSPTPTPPASSTASTIPKNSPLIASGMTPTMGALKPTSTGGHKSTLILIISAIVVLLLLGGGAYYWYTSSVTPSAEVENFDQNSNAQNSNSSSRPTSSFPTAVTSRPSGVSTSSPVMMQNNQAKSTTKPVTPPARVTRITTPFTQSQRSTVSSYIQANIDDLAIPKSSRGYEVTDISFDGPDRALVQYTNGTASYTAIAVASIDTADNVRILSFSLLEK